MNDICIPTSIYVFAYLNHLQKSRNHHYIVSMIIVMAVMAVRRFEAALDRALLARDGGFCELCVSCAYELRVVCVAPLRWPGRSKGWGGVLVLFSPS